MTSSPPIIHVKPGEMDNAVIDSLQIICPPGAENGIMVHGGAKNLTISNCEIVGATRMGIDVSAGANPGLKLINNKVHDCVPVPAPGMSSGIYTEGLTGALIKGNIVYNNGWWLGFDPNNATDKGQAGQQHGHYSNQAGGTDDSNVWDSNIFLDNLGSQIGSRGGGTFVRNVLRPAFDWALISGQYGKLAFIAGNAVFGPKADVPPNWGSGIHLLCGGYVVGNCFSGSAGCTLNPAAQDNAGNVLQQFGYWPTPGAIVVPVSTKVPTLEQWITATYGKVDLSLLQPGDAPRIIAWLSGQLASQAQPAAAPAQPTVLSPGVYQVK